MLVVRASGYLFDHQIQYPAWEPPAATLQCWIQQWGIGGVILLGGSAGELALRSQQLQAWAQIPLLLAADIEEGVGQRFAGATWFPPPMAIAAIAEQSPERAASYAEQMGQITAQEAQAIGLNWVLAPVMDVNNNPANPVINVRAFGETPDRVSQLATAFLRGLKQHPVLSVAKHFPGHGDTAIDSHLDLPVLSHTLERLQTIELPPFQAAIAAGVDAIMSAHLQIPALDPHLPTTLSPPILTGLLRQRLDFQGLIVTDALVMGAIADRYGANEAPVLAVEAGADILLMPVDPVGAIQAVCAAVATGRITPERIRDSVERIWRAKQLACTAIVPPAAPHAWETVPPSLQTQTLMPQLAQPAAIALVADILRDSMQVRSGAMPAKEAGSEYRNLIIVDDALDCEFLGRRSPAILLPGTHGYRTYVVDRQTPDFLAQLDPAPTLLQLFIRGNPFRGSAGCTQIADRWLRWLVSTEQLQAIVFYGSPYLLEAFLPELPPHLPYGFSYGQMPAAQAIVLEALLGR